MKKDMKHLLLDTGRYSKETLGDRSTKKMSIERLESLSDKEKIRPSGAYIRQGDRVNPLLRFIKRNVNRPYNKVFKEICENADLNTIRGQHLRRHFEREILRYGAIQRYWRFYRFYEDKHGIIRERPKVKYTYKKPYDPDRCFIENKRYDRINNCWFLISTKKEKKYIWCREKFDYVLSLETVESKKQLNSKELKKLGLSNDPDFEWWK